MTTEARSSREDRDIFRLAPSMDTDTIDVIANRLEFRSTDEGYLEISHAYFDDLPLDGIESILAVGCGTGVEVRALRRLAGIGVEIVGLDHSRQLIEIAERLAAEQGLSEGVRFVVGDAHALDFKDDTFDVVVLHTVMSHVDDPLQVLREARRVVRPGGTIAIFDGDYASLTFDYPDSQQGKQIEEFLLKVVVANPRVMRSLPRLVNEAGLRLESAAGVVYADIGAGRFWANVVEVFGGVLLRSGLLQQREVEAWQDYQRRAIDKGTFFGASNYYTYLVCRPLARE